MLFLRKSNSEIEKRYVKSGAIFGDVVSYLYMGECIGFEKLLDDWAKWENEYAKRGFRTVSLDRFIEFGGYGKPIDDIIGQKRYEREEPVFHAQIYRDNFLAKVAPVLNLEKLTKDRQPQFGRYILPSTEKKN